jgi:pyrimidine-specific ribonucleoside hydrolase
MKKRIIIDCDPGHDDMMAIMLACASEELEILGITTVAGNQEGSKTFQNALKTLTLIGRKEIPVARGSDRPITRRLTVAPEIHGVSGLDGAELPEAAIKTVNMHAVDFIIKTIYESEESLILVPTGPLTNIAHAMRKDLSIKERIERIVLMGGAVYDSNVTPAAEFNIYVDPEAANIVFESGIPITMVGLDVTNKTLFTFEDIKEMKDLDGPVSSIVAPLMDFFAKANREFFGFNGAPLHDALAVSYLIQPEILKTRHLHVAIETKGDLTRGRTVVDVYGITGIKPNADVAFDVDVDLFKTMMVDAIKKLDLQAAAG